MSIRMNAKGWVAVLAALTLMGAAAGIAPAVLGQTTTVTIINSAPVVSTVVLDDLAVEPTSGTTTAVGVTITITDANGYQDISSVTVEVLKPDGSTTHVASTAAAFQSGTLLVGTYAYSFDMNFYDNPTTGIETYYVKVTATDLASATGTNLAALAFFTYAPLTALDLPASPSIDFGSSLSPGGSSTVQSLDVTNAGNVPIDIQVSGEDLDHETESTSIPVGNITYDDLVAMSGAIALTTSAQTDTGFSLAKGSSSTKSTYWQLTVPDDQFLPSGTYSGTVTIAATADA